MTIEKQNEINVAMQDALSHRKSKSFSELIERQLAFQRALGAWPEDHEQLAFQVLEETYEVCRELRPISRWWSWKGQCKTDIDPVKLIEELADILHFILLYYASNPSPLIIESWEIELIESIWAHFGKHDIQAMGGWAKCLSMIAANFANEDVCNSLINLSRFCNANSISRDDLEQAYLTKLQANYQRIKQ